MADISALGQLNSSEPLDLDKYVDAKAGGSTIPPAGEYVVRAPDAFPAEAFGKTRNGDLSAQIDPTIVGPTNEGYTLRFTKVSAKLFPRGKTGDLASQLGDYLRACGIRGKVPGEPQAQADAVEGTVGRTYKVYCDWRARNKNTGYEVKGMRHFTSDGNGGFLPYTTDPNDIDPDTGAPRRLRANLEVVRFIPAE